MGDLTVQKVVYLLDTDDALTWFGDGPTFRSKTGVPFTPDDLLQKGSWRNQKIIGLSMSYRKLVPAAVFIKDGAFLVKKTDDGNYRIWFGEPILQETFLRYKTMENLVLQTVKKKRIKTSAKPDLAGYCVYRKGRVRNDFLAVYVIWADKAPDKKTEQWIPACKMHSVYARFDPLSKAIFDAFYEDERLFQQYLVLKKIQKTVDN